MKSSYLQANNGIARKMNVGQLTACKMDIMNNSNISAKNYTSLNMNAIAYIQDRICVIYLKEIHIK